MLRSGHTVVTLSEAEPCSLCFSRYQGQSEMRQWLFLGVNGEESGIALCPFCLSQVLEAGLKSIQEKKDKQLLMLVNAPPLSTSLPRQEAGAGVTGKGDVGGSMPMPVSGRGFDVVPGGSHCVARSDCGPHEPLELFPAPIHGGKLEGIEGGFFTGGTANLFAIGHGGMAANIYVQVCKHCGALYAEVVGAEKKPEGA